VRAQAIIGMNLFGNIKLQENIIFMANFRDFPTSMLLLFRMTTIENWNALMWDCMQLEDCILVDATVDVTAPDGTVTKWWVAASGSRASYLSLPHVTSATPATPATRATPATPATPAAPLTHKRRWAGTYLDSVDDAAAIESIPDWAIINQCSPAPMLAAIYFVTYMLVVVYLMVQLVIGIILENIETHARIDNMKVKQQHIQDFLQVGGPPLCLSLPSLPSITH
jgi:hypothetical protein